MRRWEPPKWHDYYVRKNTNRGIHFEAIFVTALLKQNEVIEILNKKDRS